MDEPDTHSCHLSAPTLDKGDDKNDKGQSTNILSKIDGVI